MAKSKAVKQVGGIEAEVAESSKAVGGSATTHNSAWHVPKWAYWAIGTLAGAVVLYEAVAAATALPANPFSTGRSAQPTPTAAVTPFKQPPQAVSQYQRQALEQIALIGQKEPGLAELLRQEKWVLADAQLQAYGLRKLADVKVAIAAGNYTLGSLIYGSNKTTLLALGKDEFRRTTGLQIVKSSIPLMAEFLGVSYEGLLLLVDMDSTSSGQSEGWINISTREWSIRTFTHEGGHEVYNHGVNAFAPPWFEENAAEAAGQHAILEFQKNKPEWWSLTTSFPKWGNLDHTIPNPDTLIYRNAIGYYQQHPEEVRPLASITFKDFGKDMLDSFRLGLIVFFKYTELVGDTAFKEALNHVRNVKVARSTTANKVISNQELEAILEQHVPPAKLPAFRQLYQQRVYGLPETKP